MKSWSHVPHGQGPKIAFYRYTYKVNSSSNVKDGPNFSFSLIAFGMLAYWHWEAMLISHLSTREIILPFKTMRGLLMHSDFKISIVPNTIFEDVFKYSKDPLWREGFRTRVEPYLEVYGTGHRGKIERLIKDDELAFLEDYYTGA